MWSLCSVDFHTLTLQLPIQTPHSVAPELQVFVSSLNISAKRAHPSIKCGGGHHKNEIRGVLVSVKFGCFSPSRFSHFHCNTMRKAIKAHKNLHTNQQNEHTPEFENEINENKVQFARTGDKNVNFVLC